MLMTKIDKRYIRKFPLIELDFYSNDSERMRIYKSLYYPMFLANQRWWKLCMPQKTLVGIEYGYKNDTRTLSLIAFNLFHKMHEHIAKAQSAFLTLCDRR